MTALAIRARTRTRASTTLLALALSACGARERLPARRDDGSRVDPGRGRVPSAYVLVGPRGTLGFPRPTAPANRGDTAGGVPIGAGFGFIADNEDAPAGRRYVRVRDGRWLPAADLTRVRLSTFAGVPVPPGHALRIAWVTRPTAEVRGAPDGKSIASLPRRTPIALTGPCRLGACPASDGWLRATDLGVAETLPRPTPVGPLERWLDVDLATQILVAYAGDRPVYATLVSTGVGEPPSPFATPTGLFRIRSKHEVARMDNLEHTGVAPYSYDVPLVQYFSGGKALHAAPWHDHFGRPTSHGCIGLAPRDAEWLFAFTSPAPPAGATDVVASDGQPGTWVRVRAGGDAAATSERARARPGAEPAADDADDDITAAR